MYDAVLKEQGFSPAQKGQKRTSYMQNAHFEEMKSFGMGLKFLLQNKSRWRSKLKSDLFTRGEIVESVKKVKTGWKIIIA